jgi:hypothetical protein
VRYTLPLLVATISGCAGFGEQPTDLELAGLHWYRDAPAFRAAHVEWNAVKGPNAFQRLVNLCGKDPRDVGQACTFRIREGGQCVVFSLLDEDEAAAALTVNGERLRTHELRHCGLGMPAPGGWNHRETAGFQR